MKTKEGLKISDVFKTGVQYIGFGPDGFLITKENKVIVNGRTDDYGIEFYNIGKDLKKSFDRDDIFDLPRGPNYLQDFDRLLNAFNLTQEEFEEQHPEYFI